MERSLNRQGLAVSYRHAIFRAGFDVSRRFVTLLLRGESETTEHLERRSGPVYLECENLELRRRDFLVSIYVQLYVRHVCEGPNRSQASQDGYMGHTIYIPHVYCLAGQIFDLPLDGNYLYICNPLRLIGSRSE